MPGSLCGRARGWCSGARIGSSLGVRRVWGGHASPLPASAVRTACWVSPLPAGRLARSRFGEEGECHLEVPDVASARGSAWSHVRHRVLPENWQSLTRPSVSGRGRPLCRDGAHPAPGSRPRPPPPPRSPCERRTPDMRPHASGERHGDSRDL